MRVFSSLLRCAAHLPCFLSSRYDSKGSIVREWRVRDSPTPGDSVEVALDQNLAFRHRMPEGIAEVYFACNTVRHKFVQVGSPASFAL